MAIVRSSRSRCLWSVLALLVATPACAPSLSTFQPAHVAPKGHLQVGAGMEVSAPIGTLLDTIDTAKDLAERAKSGQSLTSEEKVQVFDAGVRLLLNFPSVTPHFLVAYVPVEHLEVSLRYAGAAWRLGGRYQLVDHTTGPFDLTIGIGFSRFSYEFPLADSIPLLKLDDFSRWQMDVPILIGTSRSWYRVWAGPKLLLTSFSTTLRFELPSETDLASFSGHAVYVGGQGGIALGYKYVFFAFELTMAEMIGSARATLTIPELVDTSRDTSLRGFIVYPSFGVMGEF